MQGVRKSAAIAAMAMIAGLAMGGCTSTQQGTADGLNTSAGAPDVSPGGQVDYACALAVEVGTNHESVDEWFTGIGDEADPATHQAAGAAGLLGALTGSQVDGHGELSDAAKTMLDSLARLDRENMQQGLDALVAGCREGGLPAAAPDISAEGQVDYACALVTDVTAEHESAEEWLTGVGDDASPASYQVAGAVGLLGALTGSELDGHPELSAGAAMVYRGISRLEPKLAQQGADEIAEGCSRQ